MTLALQRNGMPELRRPSCAACKTLAGAAFAQSPVHTPAFDADTELVAPLEQASHDRLKATYVDGSNAAAQHLLGAGEVAACSIVYEILKRRVFGGDFAALLAWSRSQRAAPTGAPGTPRWPRSFPRTEALVPAT